MITLLKETFPQNPESAWARKIFGHRKICNFIILGNIFCYLIVLLLNGGEQLWRFGSLHKTLLFEEHQYYRFITACFLHHPYNVLHIGFNMLALWWAGSFIEYMYGRVNFFYIYMIAGIASTLVSYTVTQSLPADQNPETVGASGAIFGLIGAVLVFLHKYKDSLNKDISRRLLQNIYLIIALNLLFDILMHYTHEQIFIDTPGHIGGLVFGILLALDAEPLILGYKQDRVISLLAFGLLCVVVLAFGFLFVEYLSLVKDTRSSWIWQLWFMENVP